MSQFDQQFDSAFGQLAEFHGDDSVVFYLLEDPTKARSIDGVTILIRNEREANNDTTRSREIPAHLTFDVRKLPRAPRTQDQVELPGHKGRWHFRDIIEDVGGKLCVEFTQQKQLRHGGRGGAS